MQKSISEQMLHHKNQIASMKQDFEKYISDKSVPFEERWLTFINAPSELKNHENYGPNFSTMPNDFVMYDGPIHADRGHTINIKDMFQEIEDVLSEIKEGTYEPIYNWHIKSYNKLDVNALKEEILEKNIGSFDYDW